MKTIEKVLENETAFFEAVNSIASQMGSEAAANEKLNKQLAGSLNRYKEALRKCLKEHIEGTRKIISDNLYSLDD